MLLAEVKNINLPYHTYTFPDAVQPRHVLKVNSPKVPIQETRADLKFRKIVRSMETDTITQTVIAEFTVSSLTFQHGTEVCDVFRIKRSMSCIIQ